jgi:hypothetical protein
MLVERALHESALHALAAPVNQPDLPKPRCVSRPDVLFHHVDDVARRERVEIQRILDRHFVHVSKPPAPQREASPAPPGEASSYSAITDVVIPPRAEKSPVTVIRFGLHAATRSSRIWLVTAS